MFLWLYDIPVWLMGVLIIGAFVAVSVAGLYATRGLVARIIGPAPGHNEGVDTYVHSAVLVYGLIAGLVAVAVWEQYSAADEKVREEASALAALYHDVRSFPPPAGPALTGELRAYTEHLISVTWPLQEKGIVPIGGGDYIDRVQDTLYAFEPKTESQKIVETATINQFNRYVELRRSRLASVTAGLPTALWFVIVFGGVVTIVLTYFLALERFSTHVAMTIFAAIVVSLLVFMIVVVDHPFRGEVSISPDAFRLVYDHLMLQR